MMKLILKAVLLIFVCSPLLFVSCKKKKVVYTIEGIVSNTSSNENISNLTLKVEIKRSSNLNYSLYTMVMTDSQGKYSFTIENDLYQQIRITSSNATYFDILRVIAYSELTPESNVYNLKTTAKAWARLIFINSNPNAGDQLQYLKQKGKFGCDECCPATEQNLFGAANDTIICVNDGNSDYSYLYSVIGTSNTGIRSVYTPSGDTATLILNY